VRAPPAPAADLRAGWATLASVVFGLFVVILDVTIVNVALASLGGEYGADVAGLQWVVSVYTLALGVATPVAGYLGDRFGTKRTYLGALAVFTLASVLCGLAPDLPTLIAARALQGAAGGIAVPTATARLFTAFPPDRRGLALGIFSTVLVVAPSVGPLVGGLLADAGHPRWIFLVNVPVGIAGLAVAAVFLREQGPGRARRLDVAGLLLSSLGFGALLLGASFAAGAGRRATDLVVVVPLVAGVLVLAALVVVELRVPEPLLDPRLFRVRSFALATAANCLGQLAFFGVQVLVPLSLQVTAGAGGFEAGATLLPVALASGVSGIVAGRIADRIGPRLPLAVGFALLALGSLVLFSIGVDGALAELTAALVLIGLGVGVVPPLTQLAALGDLPRPDVNRATALLQTLQRTAQAVGVAFIVAVALGSDDGFARAFLVATGAALAAGVVALCLPKGREGA
jgi:EmrB/QacA subfamily drug resistance transporter